MLTWSIYWKLDVLCFLLIFFLSGLSFRLSFFVVIPPPPLATEVSSPSETVEPEPESLPPDTVAVVSTDAVPSDISVQDAPVISDAPVSENQETPAPPSKSKAKIKET